MGEVLDAPPQTSAMMGGGQSLNGEDLHLHTEIFKAHDLRRSDTPETILSDFTNRPDITLLCDKCCTYHDVRNLAYHRAYHDALLLLGYTHPFKPTDIQSLLQKRNAILQRMKSELTPGRPLGMNEVTRLNEAYELLKSDLEDVYEEMKQIHHKTDVNVRGVALNCSPACAYAIGMCSSENKRWKSHMEDFKVYQDYFGEDRNKCYMAIFDGHHGTAAAERSANELHQVLLHEMAKFDSKIKSTTARNFAESVTSRTDYELVRPETRDSFRVNLHQDSTMIVQNIMDMCYEKYDEIIKSRSTDAEEKKKKKTKKQRHPLSDKIHMALKKSYLLMDILLSYGKDERSRVRWSGTSALTVIIQNTKNSKAENDPASNKLAFLEEEVSGSEGQRSPVKGDKGVKELEELGLIHLANAGNTHALLIRDNKPYRLSKDHTPHNPRERDRVLREGGTLSPSSRDSQLNGVLSVTRGLGNHGDKGLKDCVLVDPHTTTVAIDQYAQLLVIASHGVWEVLSDEEVACLMVKMLPSQQIPAPSRVSDTVLSLFKTSDEARKSDGSKLLPGDSKNQLNQRVPSSGRITFGPELSGSVHLSGSGQGRATEGKKMETSETPNTVEINDEPDVANKTMKIVADLHTEIGSRLSDAGDDASLLRGPHLGLEEDYITVPVHSDLGEKLPPTEAELRRDLAQSMAEMLTQASLMAGSRNNITVMVVLLPGSGV